MILTARRTTLRHGWCVTRDDGDMMCALAFVRSMRRDARDGGDGDRATSGG